jgi:glycosyltransferase involved in cell wall biosynthesis
LTRRIAIVLQTPKDQHSSVFLTYRALAAELEQRGHVVSILTPQDFPSSGRFGGRLTPIAYPFAVARWMSRMSSSVDLMVFHSYAGWIGLSTGAARAAAAVVAFHGLEPIYHQELLAETGGRLSRRYRLLQERLMPLFLRAACRRADLVTCLNAAEREYLIRNRWVDADRIATVAHGVGAAFFLPERRPRALKTMLFLAQWLPMKGIATLGQAFATLARRHADLTLVCAGTLAAPEAVLAGFPDDVRARVTVRPRVDQRELAEIYRDADLFVFPSNYEGFGLALVEAMAARLPIVTTPVGVAADALVDGQSALIVPRRDPGAIVAAVERIRGDEALRSRVIEGAHAAATRYREADRLREWADRLASVACR